MKQKYGLPLPAKFLVKFPLVPQELHWTDLPTQNIGFCGLLDRQTLLDEIMGAVEDLVSDASQHVRAALGTQISGLAPILGKDE